MSYEFNPESQVFEFPNPYKVQNLGLLVAGAVAILAGGATMFAVRERLAANMDLRSLQVILVAVGLLLLGIGLVARALTQLRYFFGRDRPSSLALNLPADRDGNSVPADRLKEMLRQNAITFREPAGALNGLLYSWLPHLIFAPEVIQVKAQRQFYAFLSLCATLLSFLVCLGLFGQAQGSGWIGLAYAALALPNLAGMRSGAGATLAPPVDRREIVLLVMTAVLGPTLLSVFASRLPSLGNFSINGAIAVALACAIAGCVAFGLALRAQLAAAPQAVGAARIVETLTMNAHPSKLLEELERMLMDKWFNRIPNRRYAKLSPQLEGGSGQFAAEILEETQPRPVPGRTTEGLAHALDEPKFRWLAVLTMLAACLVISGTVFALVLARSILEGAAVANLMALMLTQFAVGLYCFNAAHALWGRFDFVSELVWVDLAGSFESARVAIGNQLTGAVQTTKSVINIESMTLRVWVSEIDTVIFGANNARQVIGMRSCRKMAEELTAALKSFGETRSMVVAPTSMEDMTRAQRVGAMQQLVAGTNAAPVEKLAAQAGLLAAAGSHCPSCRAPIDQDTKFCGECGTRLAAAN
jgi:hypothetical protein